MSLEQGKAAEHLVCFDLIMQGYNVYLSDQGLPYDAVLDCDGKLYRIQVKSTIGPTETIKKGVVHRTDRRMYRFNTRRGKNGKKQITQEDCDIVAFVALDSKTIGYIATTSTPVPQCMEFPIGRSTASKKVLEEYKIGDVF